MWRVRIQVEGDHVQVLRCRSQEQAMRLAEAACTAQNVRRVDIEDPQTGLSIWFWEP